MLEFTVSATHRSLRCRGRSPRQRQVQGHFWHPQGTRQLAPSRVVGRATVCCSGPRTRACDP